MKPIDRRQKKVILNVKPSGGYKTFFFTKNCFPVVKSNPVVESKNFAEKS